MRGCLATHISRTSRDFSGHSTSKFDLFSESQKGHPLDRSAEFGFVLQIWRLRRRRSRRRGAPCLAPLQRGVGALDQTLERCLVARDPLELLGGPADGYGGDMRFVPIIGAASFQLDDGGLR